MARIAEFIEKRSYLILGIIICIGALLRFAALTSTPPSLYWDEVSLGYNAYSIAETGKDEHEAFLPLVFQGYDDYKFPGYIYLAAIPIKLFGLSEFTTRLPSALLGTASIFFIFLLTKALLQRIENTAMHADGIAILAAFLFAISPWSISFSRAAFEANVALAFVILGSALLLQRTRQLLYTSLGLFFLLVSLYTYRSELIIVPPVLLATLLIFFKDFFSKKRGKSVIVLIFLFALLSLPIYNETFFGNASARQNQVSIFEEANEKIGTYSRQVAATDSQALGNIFLNYRLAYVDILLSNYAQNVSPEFLFLSGDPNPRHGAPNMGVLYLWEICAIGLGLVYAARVNKKVGLFLASWTLVGPLAASLATPTPHALRAMTMLPPLVILSAMGIYFAHINLKKWRIVFVVATTGVILFFFARFLYLYFEVLPATSSQNWGGGYEELVGYVHDHYNEYDSFIITGHYWNPYMYFLFYGKYSPEEFQQNGSQKGFDKLMFGGTSWDMARYSTTLSEIELEKAATGKSLIILSPDEFESQKENVNEIERVQDSTGKVTFVVSELKNK